MAARRELHGLRLAGLGLAADRQHLAQYGAGDARIDHAVVEHARAVENTSIWPSNTPMICASWRRAYLSPPFAAPDRGGFGDDRHGFGGLLAAHHGGFGVGPRETERG